MSLNDYVNIARPNHWFKNIFVLPGFFVAVLLTRHFEFVLLGPLLLGLLSISLIASANYTINEWLDAESDQHHPGKKHRPSVAGRITGRGVALQYALLAASGLAMRAKVRAD